MNELESKTIVYLRVLAMLMIVGCHTVTYPFISNMLSVGVQIFLILSAYIYGKRDIASYEGWGNWFRKRALRLLPPMYFVILIILLVELMQGVSIQWGNYLAYFFNLQGLDLTVTGAQHLWYLTVLMVCLLLTPFLECITKANWGGYWTGIISVNAIVIIASVILAYTSSHQWYGWRVLMILLYCDVYFYSKRNSGLYIHGWIGIALVFSAIAIRLLGKATLDDTIFYNTFISGFSHCVLAIGICLSVYAGVSKILFRKQIPKLIKWLEAASYEVYLVHYMFVVGPCEVKFFSLHWVNTAIAVILSFMSAFLLHYINVHMINRRK